MMWEPLKDRAAAQREQKNGNRVRNRATGYEVWREKSPAPASTPTKPKRVESAHDGGDKGTN